ncbi:hypothetical protein M0657_003996 [Pyricularia oryzae]|nr:hypothetical protein M0657_003996 [Pyricularia oryzae]
MSGRRSYHRFPKGQTCEQCPSKRWYSEDGRRYCDRGHEIEGFVEHDFEDEDGFGQKGAVARKEKEVREKASRMLSGNASRELYLQCLQLVLRKQLFWLVHDRGLPPKLETVVRDLWTLRTRNIEGLKTVSEAERDEDLQPGGERSETDGSETKMFSSGGESEARRTDRSGTGTRGSSRARSWTSEIGVKRSLPRLIDTLGLCYLGCLLMRLPVRVGDLFGWSKNNHIIYLDAIHEIPREMRARLPGQYQKALTARSAPFSGGELHETVLGLVLSFHKFYRMTFPPLNRQLLTLKYIKELALPPEIYTFTQEIVDFLNVDFTFPVGQRRVQLLDHPDVFLISCIVMVTKLICPFDDVRRGTSEINFSLPLLKIDWQQWREEFDVAPKESLSRWDIEMLTSEDAWTISPAKADDYLSWFQQVKIDPQRSSQLGRFAGLFPLQEQQRETRPVNPDEAALDSRLLEIHSKMTLQLPEDFANEDSVTTIFGARHWVWRNIDDLPPTARAFYSKAAELSGLAPSGLAKAVFMLERRLDMWIKRQRGEAGGAGQLA